MQYRGRRVIEPVPNQDYAITGKRGFSFLQMRRKANDKTNERSKEIESQNGRRRILSEVDPETGMKRNFLCLITTARTFHASRSGEGCAESKSTQRRQRG